MSEYIANVATVNPNPAPGGPRFTHFCKVTLSAVTEAHALQQFDALKDAFPAESGWSLTLTRWRTVGEEVTRT